MKLFHQMLCLTLILRIDDWVGLFVSSSRDKTVSMSLECLFPFPSLYLLIKKHHQMPKECWPSSGWGDCSVGIVYAWSKPKELTLKFSSVFCGSENQPTVVLCNGGTQCIRWQGSRSNKSIFSWKKKYNFGKNSLLLTIV